MYLRFVPFVFRQTFLLKLKTTMQQIIILSNSDVQKLLLLKVYSFGSILIMNLRDNDLIYGRVSSDFQEILLIVLHGSSIIRNNLCNKKEKNIRNFDIYSF